MKKLREDETRIAGEAAQWQRALADGDEKVRAEFADWVKASPRHLREFMFMEAVDAAARDVDPGRALEVAEDLSAVDENVVELWGKSGVVFESGSLPWRERVYRRRRFAVAAAAGLFVFAIATTWWFVPGLLGGWERYSTAVGEQRTVRLPDGSVAQLNTASGIRVRFQDGAREVRLSQGEVLFKVAHDAARPFRVHTADATIRAVGTAFNVYARDRDTQVAVVEGRVEVSRVATAVSRPSTVSSTAVLSSTGSKPAQLSAGQTARIQRGSNVVYEPKIEVSQVIAWQQRRLVFQEESLGTIAKEFNRYNRDLKIVIENASTAARRYGGTFNADDPESLVRFVTRKGNLEVERREGEIVVRERLSEARDRNPDPSKLPLP